MPILSVHGQEKKTRILFILDASSSMTYDWNTDYKRFGIARNILLQIVDSIYAVNNEVEFGVRSYGTQYPAQDKNCTDSKLLVPFNLQNVNQIKRSLQYTSPIGWSPIAYSLSESARNEINNTNEYDYSIIFITDGGESCGGDICATFQKLLESKISITPYIIGLDNNSLLKNYYDCLGKYVSVLNVDDIPKAVKLIVDANRPILDKKKRMGLKTIFSDSPVKKSTTTKAKKTSTPKKVTPVIKVVRKPSMLVAMDPYTIMTGGAKKFNKKGKMLSLGMSKLEYEFISAPIVSKPKALIAMDPLQLFYASQSVSQQTKKKAHPREPLVNKLTYTFTYIKEVPKPKPLAEKLVALRLFRQNSNIVYAYKMPRPIGVAPNFSSLVYEFISVPAKPKTIPVKPKPKKVVSKRTDGTVGVSKEVVPDDNTQVQVFFINRRNNKTYRKATPTIVMREATSKKEVKRFIRSVTRGIPDTKMVEAGNYTFTVRGSNNLFTGNVNITANSINKVYIEVTDGILRFVYTKNPSRPVEEFKAIVNPRFENKDKTVFQDCSKELYYSPGTYYIEIQSLPVTKIAMYNISFGAKHIVQVDEPGFVQINNTNRLGRVDFFHLLNDEYVRFHSIIVNGNIIDQKVQLQPPKRGPYKVVYLKNPALPQAGTNELLFRVKSNATTQLILK